MGERSTETHAPVRWVVQESHGLAYLFPYPWLEPLWDRWRPKSASFAFIYTGSWIAALTAILVTGSAQNPSGVSWIFVVVAAYRLADILNFYVGLFLNKDQEPLRGIERSLLLLFGNVVELTLITAVLLTAAYSTSPSRAWDDAFFLVTFMAIPDRGGRYTHLVEMVGITGALILIAGGVGMLVGLISDRFAGVAEQEPDEYQQIGGALAQIQADLGEVKARLDRS